MPKGFQCFLMFSILTIVRHLYPVLQSLQTLFLDRGQIEGDARVALPPLHADAGEPSPDPRRRPRHDIRRRWVVAGEAADGEEGATILVHVARGRCRPLRLQLASPRLALPVSGSGAHPRYATRRDQRGIPMAGVGGGTGCGFQS